MRTIIYGDIHGCLEEFVQLRSKIGITIGDREISVGDILDRGPYSNEVVRYARENNIELILGNHEDKYVRYKKDNPVTFDAEKQKIFANLSAKDIEYLQNAPFFLKIDNLTILHAGITNKIDLQTASSKQLKQLIRIRHLNKEQKMLSLEQQTEIHSFWSEVYNGEQGIIVYGHEAFDDVKIDNYSFGIDTGCVYGNKLTALIIQDTAKPMQNYEIVQVNAQRKYIKNVKERNKCTITIP